MFFSRESMVLIALLSCTNARHLPGAKKESGSVSGGDLPSADTNSRILADTNSAMGLVR